MKRNIYLILLIILASAASSSAQIVNIPDPKFKEALIKYKPVIDLNKDGEIQVSEAEAFTGQLTVDALGISDMTGIEAFVNLTELDCIHNNLTSLDVSKLINLKVLQCFYNFITTLDLTKNTKLARLGCIDNNLTSLDLSQNPELEYLSCSHNDFGSLDLSHNKKLTKLECFFIKTSGIDLSQNPELEFLDCSYNQITSLDLSNNKKIKTLRCSNNQISGLNLTQNIALDEIDVADNQLKEANIANGNNALITNIQMQNNPDLKCVQVDDEIYSTSNWKGNNFVFDYWVEFNKKCNTATFNPDNENLYQIYPNPANDWVNIGNLPNDGATVCITDLTGREVYRSTVRAENSGIPTSGLPNGVYLLGVKNSENTVVKKLVIGR